MMDEVVYERMDFAKARQTLPPADEAWPPEPAPQDNPRGGRLITPADIGDFVDLSNDEPVVVDPELVRDTIPQTGIGFLSGQSGAFKTFAALELAMCVMTGQPFAGRKVERTGGVIYAAFEGQGSIKRRLKARRTLLPDPGIRLPFALLAPKAQIATPEHFAAFNELLREGAAQIRREFGVPVVAVIIDTIAAGGFIPADGENDAGRWNVVFHASRSIVADLGCALVYVHHFGKSIEAGMRGSSSNRAGADFNVVMTCKRDPITGETRDHRIALEKNRDAPEGPIADVTTDVVEIAVRDDGSPITTLVLRFDRKHERPFDGVTVATLETVMRKVAAAEQAGQPYREDAQARTAPWVGLAVAEALSVDPNDKGQRLRIKSLLETWIRNGALEIFDAKLPGPKGKTARCVRTGSLTPPTDEV